MIGDFMKWYVGFVQKKSDATVECVECATLEQAVLIREQWVYSQVAEKFEPTLIAMRKRYGLPLDTPEEVSIVVENIRDSALTLSLIFSEDDCSNLNFEPIHRAMPVPDMILSCIPDECV